MVIVLLMSDRGTRLMKVHSYLWSVNGYYVIDKR